MKRTSRLTPDQRSNLVAYLDSELEAPAAQEIEQILADNPVARHDIEMLTRTAELLDVLPRHKASTEFIERTMSSIRLDEVRQPLSEQPWFQRARRGAVVAGWAVGLALSALFGFTLTSRWIPDESQQLIEELSFLQNLDIYTEVQDVEFLRELRESRLLDEEPTTQQP